MWEGSCVGHLFVVLTQLLADRPQAVEELASADWTRYTRPGRPKVLHPTQGAAVQQDSGLGGFCKIKHKMYDFLQGNTYITIKGRHNRKLTEV